MKKKLLIPLVIMAGGALLIGPVLLGLVAVLFGAAAAANPCISPVGALGAAGGPVRMPVVGGFTVTSEFGMRYNPGPYSTGQYRMHNGIDLAETPTPGPVVAAMAGVVKATPTDPDGGGNMITIDHGAGLTTTYEHLASRTVTVGDQVWAGRQVGVEGSTGNSTGAHLHFQVEINGQPTNPRDWLTQQGLTVPPTGGSGTAPAAVPLPPAGGSDVIPAVANPAPVNPTTPPGDTNPVTTTLPAQVGPYKGQQVVNAGYVIKAGQAMGLDAKTITTGVMTAMGESSLVNVDHGDAVRNDTIGLFQIGPEHGSYAQRMDPTWSATNLFTRLLAVPGYAAMDPSVAAHKAQRNADPYHYTPYWSDAVLMVATLTEDPGLLEQLPATEAVAGCEGGGPLAPPGAGDGSGAAIVAAATHYQGTPYSWGGGDIHGPSLGIYTSPSLDGTHTVGFDCSGLVLFAVYNATGIQLTHSAEDQGKDARGTSVPRDWAQLQPGDVIAFSEDGSGAPGSFGHVGIYVGDGKMVHAPRPGKTVEVVQLRGVGYYENMAWSIRRYATVGSH